MGPEGVGASTASEGPTGTRWRERVSTKKQRWRTGTTSAFDESPEKSICMTNFTEQMSLTAQKYLCDPVGLKKLSRISWECGFVRHYLCFIDSVCPVEFDWVDGARLNLDNFSSAVVIISSCVMPSPMRIKTQSL